MKKIIISVLIIVNIATFIDLFVISNANLTKSLPQVEKKYIKTTQEAINKGYFQAIRKSKDIINNFLLSMFFLFLFNFIIVVYLYLKYCKKRIR